MNKAIDIIAILLFLAFCTVVQAQDVSVDIPLLERLQVTAEALNECGFDNNSISSIIVEYDGLDRGVNLDPIALGPNGMNLAKKLEDSIFWEKGAYGQHLNRELQVRLVHAFIRVLWSVDTDSLSFFAISSEDQGKLPGGDGLEAAPLALGIHHGRRLLIMRSSTMD